MSSPFAIPQREDLIEQVRRANQFALFSVPLQLVLIAILVVLIRWKAVMDSPLVSLIAVMVMVGPMLTGILQITARNKKKIDDLKETTRFGEFDKHKLRKLYNETLVKLGLPNENLPVYITGDRAMNAMAVHFGLGAIFKSLNGIYLHRQLLHKLTAEEIQDIIGHELGHYYRHYIVSDRFSGITLLLGSLVGLMVAQLFGLDSTIGMVALMFIGGLFWLLARIWTTRLATTIEFLCDDFGAHVHGVEVSINGLMKLGSEAELHTAVIHQALLNKNADKLDARELLEAVQNAIPYGNATPDELLDAVELAIRKRVEDRRVTIGGFISYLWKMEDSADENEAMQDELKKMGKMQSLPRLRWESLLRNPREIAFDQTTLPRLIEMIEQSPDSVLFRIQESTAENPQVHPPLKYRILYLWYNRDQIQRSRHNAK